MKNWKLRAFIILFLLSIFYNVPVNFINSSYSICLSKFLLGYDCWGCGTTRAFWCILHCQFQDAL